MQGSLFFDEHPPVVAQAAQSDVDPYDLTFLPFTPRDYQVRGILRAFELFDQGEMGVIFRQPTGSGKTVSGSAVAALWLRRNPQNRVLILCHERQLVRQFAEEVEKFSGVQPGIEMAGQAVKANSLPLITVASRQTLLERTLGGAAAVLAAANEALQDGCEFVADACDELPFDDIPTTTEPQKTSRLYKFDPERFNWLVMFDECHRYAYKLKSVRHIIDWFERNPNNRRFGLTATPERTDGTTLGRLFPGIASDYRLYDIDGGPCAVNDGWSVKYDQRFVTVHGVDFKTLREVSGDFDEGQLEELLTERKQLLSLIKPTMDIVGARRTIIFNPTVGMAKMVAHTINEFARFKCLACESVQWEHADDMRVDRRPCKQCGGALEEVASGELARSLDGSYADHLRQETYSAHQAGYFQFLSVCGLCREGYNDPGIGAVAIFRPSKSRALVEQMKGRGCRPLRGLVDGLATPEERKAAIAASDKPNCIIVDLVGATGLADCASTAHIMAEGKPDEVIELANKKAMESEGPCDMAEKIREAEAEIEAAKAEAERKRLEAEERAKRRAEEQKLKDEQKQREREAMLEKVRQEREAADRLRKLRGDVDYSERQVQPGGGGVGSRERKSVPRMQYGKHAGKSVTELPGGYMRAILEKNKRLPPYLRDAMQAELARREQNAKPQAKPQPVANNNGPCTEAQARVLAKHGKPTNVTQAEAGRLIMDINRELSERRSQRSKTFQESA